MVLDNQNINVDYFMHDKYYDSSSSYIPLIEFILKLTLWINYKETMKLILFLVSK